MAIVITTKLFAKLHFMDQMNLKKSSKSSESFFIGRVNRYILNLTRASQMVNCVKIK